jgi:hypothetical protein
LKLVFNEEETINMYEKMKTGLDEKYTLRLFETNYKRIKKLDEFKYSRIKLDLDLDNFRYVNKY